MRSKYRFLISALIITVIMTGCNKLKPETPVIPENSEGNPLAVIITPNTALRVDPLIFTSRIAQLKKGEVGEVLEKSSEKKPVAGTVDFWYKIRLSNGISGWVYGSNINILKDSNRDNVESYLSQFWEKETEELSAALHGRWWSVNRFNDFTSHVIEIYKDGKYKSYIKGNAKKFEGDYNFDFNNSKIIFLNGTTFEGDLNYTRRGEEFTLSREDEKDEIKFKKINVNPESEDEVEQKTLQKNDEDTDNAKKENEG
jgi:uncharacterized protein YgiM (DUF1202 family)